MSNGDECREILHFDLCAVTRLSSLAKITNKYNGLEVYLFFGMNHASVPGEDSTVVVTELTIGCDPH